MKKVLSVIGIVLVLLTTAVLTVDAKNEITVSLQTDTELKPGRSFQVILKLSSETEIGAVYCNINYDCERLRFSAVSMEDKQSEEYLKYDDCDGNIRVIYMTETPVREREILLKFIPESKIFTVFDFDAEILEAYTFDNEPLTIQKEATLQIDMNDDNQIEETTSEDVHESTVLQQESLRELPSRSEGSVQSKVGSSDQQEESDGDRSTDDEDITDYFVTTEDTSQTNPEKIYTLIGVVLLFLLGIVITVKEYKKYHKKK